MYDLDKIAALLPQQSRFSRGEMYYFNEIDSTNTWLLAQKKVDGVLCLAGFQTAGRGRRSKSWLATPHAAILISMGWKFNAARVDGLSLVSGLALLGALEQCGVNGLALKWPNDVLLFGKKLAGILVETCGNKHVVGIGVNVLPPVGGGAIDQPWTDLQSAGFEIDTDQFVSNLASGHDRLFSELEAHGFAGFSDLWNARHGYQQREVEVACQGEFFRGMALGVNQFGALQVESENHVKEFSCGVESVRLVDTECRAAIR